MDAKMQSQKQNRTTGYAARSMAAARRPLVRAVVQPPVWADGFLQIQRTAGNRAAQRMLAGMDTVPVQKVGEEEGGNIRLKPAQTLQRAAEADQKPNQTGLPDDLKAGLETLSGFDLSGMRVHKNSGKPARVGALAYTQGGDIYVAPGQERHLPHEGWHAVQQMQGRVKPAFRMKGVEVNDDVGLEREASEMGVKAVTQPLSQWTNWNLEVNNLKRIPAKRTCRDTIKNDGILQLMGRADDLTRPERVRVETILRNMGVNPNKVILKKWIQRSECSGNTIYIENRLLTAPEDELRFTLGHELSHYITRDNKTIGWGSALTGLLGGLASYLDLGVTGGLISTIAAGGLSLLSGGGIMNAAIHAGSVGGTVMLAKLLDLLGFGPILGPLATGLLAIVIGKLPKILERLSASENKIALTRELIRFSPETIAQLIMEIKADVHSAIKLNAATGGIEHFRGEMKENQLEMLALTTGNTIYDPWHPPLSLRVTYLEILKKLVDI
jgi:hypothetical protein